MTVREAEAPSLRGKVRLPGAGRTEWHAWYPKRSGDAAPSQPLTPSRFVTSSNVACSAMYRGTLLHTQ